MKNRNVIVFMLLFCLLCSTVSGCKKIASNQEVGNNPIEWEIQEDGVVITYHSPSEHFYEITQLPFPTFWGGAAYSIITPNKDLYLVDGGFQGEDAVRLADYITSHGGKVKGWILTHPHVDHIGAFLDYAALYPDTIEKVYYAPFTKEFFAEEQDPATYQVLNNAILFDEFLTLQEQTKDQIEYIPLLTHDRFMLEDLVLECFYSFSPALKDVNGNSLVFTLSYQDFTLLLTADMTEATLQSMKDSAAANSALWDVDIIQIPHHGYIGGITTEELYLSTGAKLALLDCTKEEYEQNSAQIQTTTQLLEELNIPFFPRFLSESGNKIYLYK